MDAIVKQKFKETEIKYLAGLIDADGSLYFNFVKYKDKYNVRLLLVLQQSESIDKDGCFIKSLRKYMGFVQTIKMDNEKWSDANRWVVTNANELNMLLPRLTKHMVIKAKHFKYMHEKYNSIYGKSVSYEEMLALKEFAKISRKNTGPLKPKNHPTWAWIAGYLDGDGCYYMRNRKKNWGIFTELQVSVVAHNDDLDGLRLLNKAFNGKIRKHTKENTYTWIRNLGNSDRSFAIAFLRKVHWHSQLKKHKIEQLLNFHLQRLNE